MEAGIAFKIAFYLGIGGALAAAVWWVLKTAKNASALDILVCAALFAATLTLISAYRHGDLQWLLP